MASEASERQRHHPAVMPSPRGHPCRLRLTMPAGTDHRNLVSSSATRVTSGRTNALLLVPRNTFSSLPTRQRDGQCYSWRRRSLRTNYTCREAAAVAEDLGSGGNSGRCLHCIASLQIISKVLCFSFLFPSYLFILIYFLISFPLFFLFFPLPPSSLSLI